MGMAKHPSDTKYGIELNVNGYSTRSSAVTAVNDVLLTSKYVC